MSAPTPRDEPVTRTRFPMSEPGARGFDTGVLLLGLYGKETTKASAVTFVALRILLIVS
ncbi:hypothetical protein GCM10009563_12610 [Subtercola frigoramans]